jgi:hypothetical protein
MARYTQIPSRKRRKSDPIPNIELRPKFPITERFGREDDDKIELISKLLAYDPTEEGPRILREKLLKKTLKEISVPCPEPRSPVGGNGYAGSPKR